MPRSTVQRTLAECKRHGWTYEKVEHWVAVPGNAYPGGGYRKDLFGFIDVLAVRDEFQGSLGIQSTAGSGDVAKHLAKARDKADFVRAWLNAGNQLEIWSWAKRGPRGKRKLWTVKRRPILLGDLTIPPVPF